MSILRSRWPYFAVGAVGLVLYLAAAAAQMRVAALPDDFPFGRLDYPVRVGDRTAGSPGELAFQVQDAEPGARVRVVEPDGSVTEARVEPRFGLTHRLVTYASGLIFWLVSVSFFAPRADRPATRSFFWATFLYGLAIMTGDVFRPPDAPAWGAVFPLLRVVSLALVVAFFVHISLEFPRRHPAVDAQRLLVPALFAVPAAVAAWECAALLGYLRAPSPDGWAALAAPGQAVRFLFVAYFVTGVVLFYRSGRRAERSRERDQIAWIVWGIGIGAVPFVILWTLPVLFGREPMVPLALTRLFSIACPLAFALAIVRHQFLDIDVIVRRSLIFAGLAGVLVFVYFLLGVWLEALAAARFPALGRVVSVAAVIVPVLLFGPTRRWIARAVDRSLFQIRDSQRRTLEDLVQRLREALRHEEVVEALRGALDDALRPRRCVVLLREGGRTVRAGDDDGGRPGDRIFAELAEWFLSPGRPVAATEATAVPELESERFPASLRAAGLVLAVPVTVSPDCRALILLGERTSGRRYLDLDLDFVAGVAANGREALERVGLMQRIAEETLARRQLDELNRQKSEFLSRVAHDLRTPLTSIRWSVQNLIDGVAGETTDRQREYFAAMHASVGHLSRLVEDLLEVGRLESGAAEVRTGRVKLGDVVGESLKSLGPIAAASDVRLEARIPPGDHDAHANADMVLAVVNNLVENAVRFAPAGTAVEVTLDRDDRWRRLSVRDHGPGVPEADREAIFERFRQGTPARGTSGRGFGLGLYVVRSFLEALDGRVWVENHPEGGACFVCLIPAWPSAETVE